VGATPQPHWLLSRDMPSMWLAHRAIGRTGGLSGRLLSRQIPRPGPAVVHAHFGPVGWAHRGLASSLSAPLIVAFYGEDASARTYVNSDRWRKRYRILFEAAQMVVVEGPAMAARLEALGCPTQKLTVVRLPADTRCLARCEHPKADSFRVVVAGRFIEKKGFDTAIRAFARALKGRADAELLIIGGGELEAEYRRLVAESGIETQVSWAGRLPFEDFMSRVMTAHIGLFPSRTAANGDSEGGAPVTLIESQWLGVPSIVSDHDDLPFVTAPDGGIIIPALDVAQWAEALGSLYHDSTKLGHMSHAARDFARTHHSPQANAQAREHIYDGAG
jgi:colanic acid/amylovoran biosynthesis glycosyltransferase